MKKLGHMAMATYLTPGGLDHRLVSRHLLCASIGGEVSKFVKDVVPCSS